MRVKPLNLTLKGMRLVSLAAIAMLALAACSPSSSSGATPTTASSAPTTAVTMAATSAPTTAATSAATMASTSAATTAATAAGTASATTAPASTVTLTVKTDAKLGQFLADDKGMTLYMYTKDTAGKSTCEGTCAQIWPPLLVAQGGKVTITGGDQTLVGTLTRSDGSTQVTYRNLPLYYFSKDKAPGDTNGQGVGTVWFVVKP